MEEVNRLFKPEFLNRIDETIVFHALNREHVEQIMELMIRTINKRTQDQLKMTLNLDEEAKQFLMDKGYDRKYGARPLRRTIQNELEDMMAEEILMGKIKAGDVVEVTAKDGALQVKA